METQNTSTTTEKRKRARVRGKSVGFRLRLRNGKWSYEIRSNKYDQTYSGTYALGTSQEDARKMTLARLHELESADVDTIENKTLKRYTVRQLIETFETHHLLKKLREENASWRNEAKMIKTFKNTQKAICDMRLSETKRINLAFRAEITAVKQTYDRKGYSFTRQCSPIRTIFKRASQILFPLEGRLIDVPNPLLGIEWPKDESGREFPLKWGDELKIFDAIFKQCPRYIDRCKWILLVQLALTTALRRGVLLRLKWQDIDWNNKVIKIDKSYWNGKKKAPPMVPLTHRLNLMLRQYLEALPKDDQRLSYEIFLIKRRKMDSRTSAKIVERKLVMDRYEERIARPSKFNPKKHKIVKTDNRAYLEKFHDKTKWVDLTWRRIIRRTDLFKYVLDPNGNPFVNDNGEPLQDWFHFHDLRHTAVTRYAEPPYNLGEQEYQYLKGNKIKYNNPQHIDINNRIREKIEEGDKAIEVSPARQAAWVALRQQQGIDTELETPEKWLEYEIYVNGPYAIKGPYQAPIEEEE